jgi:hypothetical protein
LRKRLLTDAMSDAGVSNQRHMPARSGLRDEIVRRPVGYTSFAGAIALDLALPADARLSIAEPTKAPALNAVTLSIEVRIQPKHSCAVEPRRQRRCLMTARLSDNRPVPRRGLSRDESAMYLGISSGKFDELVNSGRMPPPRRIDSRRVWDIRSLDVAFDRLPIDDSKANGWEDAE